MVDVLLLSATGQGLQSPKQQHTHGHTYHVHTYINKEHNNKVASRLAKPRALLLLLAPPRPAGLSLFLRVTSRTGAPTGTLDSVIKVTTVHTVTFTSHSSSHLHQRTRTSPTTPTRTRTSHTKTKSRPAVVSSVPADQTSQTWATHR